MRTSSPINVYLIPTTSYNLHSKGCDLFKLSAILNRKQARTGQAFRFHVLLSNYLVTEDVSPDAYNSIGLILQQRIPFRNFRFNEQCDTPVGTRIEAEKTYV